MTKGQKIGAFIGVIVLAIVGIIVKMFVTDSSAPATPSNDKKTPIQPVAEQKQTTPIVTPEGGKSVSDTETYQNPAGSDQVGFTVIVDKNGVITGAETKVLAENRASIMYQQNFAQALPAAVTGKKLSELTKIDRIAGASLTTEAFNQALSKLKAAL